MDLTRQCNEILMKYRDDLCLLPCKDLSNFDSAFCKSVPVVVSMHVLRQELPLKSVVLPRKCLRSLLPCGSCKGTLPMQLVLAGGTARVSIREVRVCASCFRHRLAPLALRWQTSFHVWRWAFPVARFNARTKLPESDDECRRMTHERGLQSSHRC